MNTEWNIEFTSDFPNAIEEFPETIKKAREALEKKDYQTAKNLFDELIINNKNLLSEFYYAKGVIAKLNKDFIGAKLHFKEAESLKGPSVHFMKGQTPGKTTSIDFAWHEIARNFREIFKDGRW